MDPVTWEQYPEAAAALPEGFTLRRRLVRIDFGLWVPVFDQVPKK